MYVYDVTGYISPSTCVEVRGQLLGVASLLPPSRGSSDQTQIFRLRGKLFYTLSPEPHFV